MQELQNHIQDHLAALLMDPSSIVKRAVLHNISSLCVFLGRQKTNDVLLSHMITYLNDRDWLLRYAFFESIVDVAACAGGRSLEEYILPLMIQALSGSSILVRRICRQSMLTPDLHRCRRKRCGSCVGGTHQLMRAWPLPEDANMGANELNTWIPLSSQHLDTTRGRSLYHFRHPTSSRQRHLVHPVSFAAALLEIGHCRGRCPNYSQGFKTRGTSR